MQFAAPCRWWLATVGALAFANLTPDILGLLLGALLVLTVTAGLTQWANRWTPHGALIRILGALSGLFAASWAIGADYAPRRSHNSA